MSSCFRKRYMDQPKENDIKYNFTGKTKILAICLDYKDTENPLTCTIDGKRIIKEAKNVGVKDICAMFDDGKTPLYPSYQNVTEKMAEMAASCNPGDFFVVYYSGHGTSVEDQDGDESDGMDEAFCLRSEETGEIEELIDDEIADIISQNLGDNIPCLFIVDACHSGSILDLSTSEIWKKKKVFCISGCQDSQTSNDTGDGGQMTNILLSILKPNKAQRKSGQLSIQYIFNRMVVENDNVEIENNGGDDEDYEDYDEYEGEEGEEYEDYEYVDYDDEEGEFEEVNEEPEEGQWINLSWNGGSDPTKVAFPF